MAANKRLGSRFRINSLSPCDAQYYPFFLIKNVIHFASKQLIDGDFVIHFANLKLTGIKYIIWIISHCNLGCANHYDC